MKYNWMAKQCIIIQSSSSCVCVCVRVCTDIQGYAQRSYSQKLMIIMSRIKKNKRKWIKHHQAGDNFKNDVINFSNLVFERACYLINKHFPCESHTCEGGCCWEVGCGVVYKFICKHHQCEHIYHTYVS